MAGWGLGKGAGDPLNSYPILQWLGNIFLVGNGPWRQKIVRISLPLCCLALWVSLGFILGLRIWNLKPELSTLVSVFLTSLALAAIQSRRHTCNSKFMKLDKFFGDLSYSI